MKRLFSILGKKEAEPAAPPPANESTTFLTGDDRIDSRNVRLLLDSMAELISEADPDELVRKIVDRAIEAVRAERGILFLVENGELSVAVARDAAGNDLELEQTRHSTTVVREVHQTGEGLCLKIGDSDQATDLSASVVDLKLRAVMCVRLRFQDKVLGVIYVDSRVTSREFTNKDLRFFDALGVALSISLENARLIREALEKQALKQSLEIAAEILSDLLPEDPTHCPGFEVAGLSIPAETAAGDYYDFVRGSKGQLGIVLGDVTGHGVGPAMVMTGARSAFRILFEDALTEAQILERLNRRLAEDLADDMFMSMIVCRLDPETRQLHYANAGQSAPLLLKASGELQTLSATGLALGIEPEFTYQNQAPVTMESGDVMAVFSDGILEIRGPGDSMFGNEGIAEVLRAHREKSAKEILEHLYQKAKEYSQAEDLDDDITLVIVKAQ